MEGLTLLFFWVALPGFLFSAVRRLISRRTKPKGRFPGPRLFPLVGRVHDVPRFSLWLKFKEWADQYGPIYYLRIADQRFIIVTDQQIADELLNKRGNIYSGRPQIRSLINHKQGPAYSALMDRHGRTPSNSLRQPQVLMPPRYLAHPT